MSTYRTAPYDIDRMPPGIPYIIGNEAAERFSYYGMRSILVLFMTRHLLDAAGDPDPMSEADATGWFHLFGLAVYATPLLGAILADWLFGKYRTIMALSLVYCGGHLALAIDDTRMGLLIGLSLIALGSGGIKPCVSAHVGDQFGLRNSHLMERVFGWFYVAINVGAALSMAITPLLLERFSTEVAFGIPGVLMAVATLVFFMGRHRFVHIPAGGRLFFRETLGAEGLRVLGSMLGFVLFIAMFWALFDQMSSSWVLQGTRMERMITLPFAGEVEINAGQMQAVNPVAILVLVPVFNGLVYPWAEARFPVTAPRKMAVGFFLAAGAFGISATIESLLMGGARLHILWQITAYVVITAAEVLISTTALDFFYKQAPLRMKSLVMSIYLLSVAVGNGFTSAINFGMRDADGRPLLEGSEYFLFFGGCMLITALLFLPIAIRFRGRTYVQGEDRPETG